MKHIKTLISYLIVGLLVLLCVCSCRTTENIKTEIEYRDRVEYRDRLLRDSVYVSDSVMIYLKGDTVFNIQKSIIYKDRVLRDTVAITDTLKLKITETKTVEKKVKNPLNLYLTIYALFLTLGILLYLKFKR